MHQTSQTAFWLLSASILLVLSSSLAAQPSRDGTGSRESAHDAARMDRVWLREWEDAAQYYLPFEGQYICFPTYSPDRPSSSTVSLEDYCRESAYTAEYKDLRGRNQALEISKPIEEAQAAFWLLSDPRVGQYGFIQSGRIIDIRSDNELVLRYVHLINGDAMREAQREETAEFRRQARELISVHGTGSRKQQGDRERTLRALHQILDDAVVYRFEDRVAITEIQKDRAFSSRQWRIVGYSTAALTVDERWPQGVAADRGLNLAIVDVDQDYITAVPAALLGRPLTELQFLEVLESRGLTKDEFVSYVEVARRELRRGYMPAVIRRIEGIPDTPELAEDLPAEETPTEGGLNDTVELAD